jgi:hypothetical protein
MEKHILSKSTYIKGEQCLKALYLHKKRYFLRDRMPPERVAVFTRGIRLGLLAQQLFPGGIDCGIKSPRGYQKAIDKTRNAMNTGVRTIYEAAFLKHNTLIFLDILVKKDDGWHAYEVKSSVKLSETYYKDAALQNYVLKESGVDIKSFNLIYINRNYSYEKFQEIEKAFIIEDVTEEVESRYETTAENIKKQLTILLQPHSPKIKPGLQCREPYDCDFIGHCWKHLPEKSVFDIASLTFKEKIEIYEKYGADAEDAIKLFEPGTITYNQLKSLIDNKLIVDRVNLDDFLKGNKIAFIQLLYFYPALPVFENTTPYKKIPFGFAIEIVDGSLESVSAVMFLAKQNNNPEMLIKTKVEELLKDCDKVFYYADSDNDAGLETDGKFNLNDIFTNGTVAAPKMSDYRFSTVYQSITGEIPRYKKIRIEQQAANVYEKAFRNNFSDENELIDIEVFLSERLKYIKTLYSRLSEI